MKMRERGSIIGLKTDLTYRYLYLGYSQLIIYSIYLLLFLLFYKKKELYFILYQMINKIFFSLKPLFYSELIFLTNQTWYFEISVVCVECDRKDLEVMSLEEDK